MKVAVEQVELAEVETDLVVIGLGEDGELPAPIASAAGADDAPTGFKKTTLLRPDGFPAVLVVGLGKSDELDAERLRVVAAVAAKEASRLQASSLAWAVPEFDDSAAAAEALVAGTILASYRFTRFKSGDGDDSPRLEALTLVGPAELGSAAEVARVAAEAQNRARDLQNTPANVATPTYLAERAEEIAAASEALSTETLGRAEIEAKGMGGILAVSQGGPQEPNLVVLRYRGGGSGPTLALVGKGVTFDTGGISLKPGAGMQDMKMDMSGAAAVLEAVAAKARRKKAPDRKAPRPTNHHKT